MSDLSAVLQNLDKINEVGKINVYAIKNIHRPAKDSYAIALLYCEDRKTYRCHPSYTTIGKRVGMSKNTVKKYVSGLVKKKLITTEPSRIITADGRKRNGSLIYNIRPIEEAIGYYYVRQIERLKRNIAVKTSTLEKQKRPNKAG